MKLILENWRQYLKEGDNSLNEGVWDTLTKERSWDDPLEHKNEISDQEWEDFISEQQNARRWLSLLEDMGENWMEKLKEMWPKKRAGGSQPNKPPGKGKDVSPAMFYSNLVRNPENNTFFSHNAARSYLPQHLINQVRFVKDTLIEDTDMNLKQRMKNWGVESLYPKRPHDADYQAQVQKNSKKVFLHIKTFLEFYGEFLRDVYCFFKPETLGCDLDLTSTPIDFEEI